MPNVLRTPLSTILPAVTAQLAAGTGLPTNRIGLLAREAEPPAFQGDQDLWVRAGDPTPLGQEMDGTGRIATVISRPLLVILRSRYGVDPSDRDDALLLDPSYGHLAFEEAVASALHLFWPMSAAGDAYSREPLHWMPSARPSESAAAAPVRWTETRLLFEVQYFANLTQSATG